MSEIVVVPRVTAQPDHAETVGEAIALLGRECRKEEGCVSCEVFAGSSDGVGFLIYEVWASKAALATHGQTAHIAAFKSAVLDLAQVSVEKLARL